MADEDVHKTAMRARYGSYEFLVILFELYNAAATFMSIMNGIFYEEMDKCVVVYIDEIFIYSKSELDHAWDLRRVLEKLRQNKFYMNAEKNEFSLYAKPYVELRCIRPDPKKI